MKNRADHGTTRRQTGRVDGHHRTGTGWQGRNGPFDRKGNDVLHFFFSAQQKLVICNCSKKIFTIGQTAMKRHCGATYRFCSTQRYIHGREVARDRRCDGMVVTGETGRVVFTVYNILYLNVFQVRIFSCCENLENGKLFGDHYTTFPLMFIVHFHSPPWYRNRWVFLIRFRNMVRCHPLKRLWTAWAVFYCCGVFPSVGQIKINGFGWPRQQ